MPVVRRDGRTYFRTKRSPNYKHAAAGVAGMGSLGKVLYDEASKAAYKALKDTISSSSRGRARGPGRPAGSKNKPKAHNYRGRIVNRATGSSFTGRAYTGTATFGSNMTKFKRAVRGNPKSKFGRVVVNSKGARMARANNKKYPEYIKQTYYLCTPNMDVLGERIMWQDQRYTNDSFDAKHLTGILFNVGASELNWDPTSNRIGNSHLLANTITNPLYQLNNLNTTVESVASMITQTNLPETSTPYNVGTTQPTFTYTIPNTLLTGINLNLTLGTASAQDQYLTVKVLRYTSELPVIPGWFDEAGTVSGNLVAIKELMNRHNATSGKKYQTIFQTTLKLKGLTPSTTKYTTHRVKKFIKIDYSRSTARRIGSATEEVRVGTSALPQFEVDQTGAMYNNCFIIITSSLTDDQYVAKTTTQASNTGTPPVVTQWIEHTSIRDMERVETGFAKFRYGGTIQVIHKAQEASRGFTSASAATTNNNLVMLEKRILSLEKPENLEKNDEKVIEIIDKKE